MQHEGDNRKTFTAKNIYKKNQEFKVGMTQNKVIQSFIPGCIATSIMLDLKLCSTFCVLCGFCICFCGISSLRGTSKNSLEFFPADTIVTEQL